MCCLGLRLLPSFLLCNQSTKKTVLLVLWHPLSLSVLLHPLRLLDPSRLLLLQDLSRRWVQ